MPNKLNVLRSGSDNKGVRFVSQSVLDVLTKTQCELRFRVTEIPLTYRQSLVSL